MSASSMEAGLITPLPCTWVRPRMRSRSAAARSNSIASDARSISAASSFCTEPALPDRKARACATRWS